MTTGDGIAISGMWVATAVMLISTEYGGFAMLLTCLASGVLVRKSISKNRD
jgi:hypothetical protein